MANQRTALKKGTLMPDRVARLNRIRFQPDPLAEIWNGHFNKLVAYHASHGHCNVQSRCPADRLFVEWVYRQHMALKNGTLQPARVSRLKTINFQADLLTEQWNEQFSKLEAYHASNGHCNMPRRANHTLGRWVTKQRTFFKNGTLEPERISRLNRIGFQADPVASKWNEQFRKLEAYHASNGHCNVQYQADRPFAEWVCRQRTALNNGTLKPERAARLAALRFQADPQAEKWNERCSELEAYHASHGHCHVPQKASALGVWVVKQRMAFKNGTLRPERMARLKGIGFQAGKGRALLEGRELSLFERRVQLLLLTES